MKKRILILGVALVLFALVVGVVFAAELNGVYWTTIKGKSPRLTGQTTDSYTEIYNSNSYSVKVDLDLWGSTRYDVAIPANGTIHMAGTYTVLRVKR